MLPQVVLRPAGAALAQRPGRFAVRDHWIARLLDVVDLLRTALGKLH